VARQAIFTTALMAPMASRSMCLARSNMSLPMTVVRSLATSSDGRGRRPTPAAKEEEEEEEEEEGRDRLRMRFWPCVS
jgi:hypothetical protein